MAGWEEEQHEGSSASEQGSSFGVGSSSELERTYDEYLHPNVSRHCTGKHCGDGKTVRIVQDGLRT